MSQHDSGQVSACLGRPVVVSTGQPNLCFRALFVWLHNQQTNLSHNHHRRRMPTWTRKPHMCNDHDLLALPRAKQQPHTLLGSESQLIRYASYQPWYFPVEYSSGSSTSQGVHYRSWQQQSERGVSRPSDWSPAAQRLNKYCTLIIIMCVYWYCTNTALWLSLCVCTRTDTAPILHSDYSVCVLKLH